MEISLDKPGFGVGTMDAEVQFSDPPRSSGLSSSTSGETARRSCNQCHGRMSSFSLDKHLFCMKCQGSECSMNSRCDECMQWTKEEMEKYVKLCKSFSSKRKRSKSSPPRSIPHDRDADVNLATQLDSIQKSVDDKIETMSINLMSRFLSMLVLVNSSWKFRWINLDLVLEPWTLRCSFPIHQDRRDCPLQHLERLLVDRAINVMAG